MRESRLFINPTLSPQTSDEFPQTFGINLIGGTEPCERLEELNSAGHISSIIYFTAEVKCTARVVDRWRHIQTAKGPAPPRFVSRDKPADRMGLTQILNGAAADTRIRENWTMLPN
jgi:hypothetical protein